MIGKIKDVAQEVNTGLMAATTVISRHITEGQSKL
eukprot:SAG22_NODE_13109_length_417_cov_1.843260_1_plen_34_part_01